MRTRIGVPTAAALALAGLLEPVWNTPGVIVLSIAATFVAVWATRPLMEGTS